MNIPIEIIVTFFTLILTALGVIEAWSLRELVSMKITIATLCQCISDLPCADGKACPKHAEIARKVLMKIPLTDEDKRIIGVKV